MKVRLTLEPDGATCLESPYDRAFVEGLKLALDYGGRSWDAERKRWLVSALYADVLVTFLRDYGCQIQDDRRAIDSAVPPPPMPTDLREAFDGLYLAYSAPLCVAESAYRALSKYYHPDHGGDPDLFHQVNDAIEIIRHYLDPRAEEKENDIPF